MISPLISICIPSYNRTRELYNLLSSIDCDPADVEVVICEDFAPRRPEVRALVSRFSESSAFTIRYFENRTNLGFDANLRQLVDCSNGKYIIFMGDDDLFVPGALNEFIAFLGGHQDTPYVLRSYITKHPDGSTEFFRYLPKSQFLKAGEATVAWLFKRSVSLSGFTILREQALEFRTADLDGSLLYQVYLMAQVCLRQDSIYCDIPFTHAVQTFREGQQMFGNAEAEKKRFTPGIISHDNSLNFAKSYFEVTDYLDKQHCTNLTQLVRIDLSKYSYPFLSIQRKRGIFSFLEYAKRLEIEMGLGCTSYFYFYKWALVLIGERKCDRLIYIIKRIVGHTPNF